MMLDFGEAVRRYYRNYTNPHGRSQRSAYWWVLLYQLILYTVLLVVMWMADGGPDLFEAMLGGDTLPLEEAFATFGTSGKFALFLAILFGLTNILPDIMLQIRRFHDLGKTGWLVLVFRVAGAFPVIGNIAAIANLVWFAIPGTNGPNQYGPDPLQPDMDVFG